MLRRASRRTSFARRRRQGAVGLLLGAVGYVFLDLALAERGIALELLCQRQKDAVGVPGPRSRNARRSPAQRGLPAELSHLRGHEHSRVNTGARAIRTPTGRKHTRLISHKLGVTRNDWQRQAHPLGSSKLNISA